MTRQLSRAVMERRAKGEVEADDPQTKLYRALEFFPTPPWAARAGAELIRIFDPEAGSVWEPACGQGHMAEPLKEYFPEVVASDVYDHGYGSVGDFLAQPCHVLRDRPDWIVTNPPFAKAAEFVRLGLERADNGVAVLCRLALLEGGERYELLYRTPRVSLVVAPFSGRVGMQLGSWDPDLSTATAYAWFFFCKPRTAAYRVTNMPRIFPIPPDAKLRLTKETDARRFAKRAEAPLFGEGVA